MPVPALSVDELLAVLRKTTLPTVLVEGTSDVKIYRYIEGLIGTRAGNVLSCGGRTKLLEIFQRRGEFSHVPLAFLADKDMWCFQSIPNDYLGIVWTHGISIENDVYVGSRVEDLMDVSERQQFEKLLDCICEWYGFEVEQFLDGAESHHGANVGKVLNDERSGLREAFLKERNFQKPQPTFAKRIRSEYRQNLGGKTLFSLLAQILSAPKRDTKHSKSSLVEIALKLKRDPDFLVPLVEQLNQNLNPQLTLKTHFDAIDRVEPRPTPPVK